MKTVSVITALFLGIALASPVEQRQDYTPCTGLYVIQSVLPPLLNYHLLEFEPKRLT